MLLLLQHSRHDAPLDDTEFAVSTPVTGKVASRKDKNKENIDTESALRNEMPFVLPAPKTPLAKSQIETQAQPAPLQAAAFRGTLDGTSENLKHINCSVLV